MLRTMRTNIRRVLSIMKMTQALTTNKTQDIHWLFASITPFLDKQTR